MKRIFLALLASIVLISCGDDEGTVEEEFFAQFEGQWLSTSSDKFGIEIGEGTYFFKFENGIVSHYVSNGEFDGVLYTWNYRYTTLDGDDYMELISSPCWVSSQGGSFGILPTQDNLGFRFIDTSTFSEHSFYPAEPNFPEDLDTNPCADLSNEWIDNYNGVVFSSERNDNTNLIVFENGVAYVKTGKGFELSRAFTYATRADTNFEYMDILDICPDYEVDFEMFRGDHTVNELNNVNGLRTSGFIITRGIAQVTYVYFAPEYTDELLEDCYISSVE